jgi:hypothetical protein
LFFAFILFVLPFGWENTLAGFQAQFYFVLFFSLISLWLLVTQSPFSSKWWIGLFFLLLAFFCIRYICCRRGFINQPDIVRYLSSQNPKNKLLAIILLGALFFWAVKLTPVLPYHAVYKAHSVSDLYHSITSVFGWPFKEPDCSPHLQYAFSNRKIG